MEENTKIQIKNRMIKKAASLWGVAPNEIEMSFDPIVSLLIAACASEIEKIASNIDDSQTRITEKLIQLMTPETISGPKPAHAIIQSNPSEDVVEIGSQYLFYHKKKVSFKNTSIKHRDVGFSPIQNFKLVDANIKYLATGNSIVEFDKKKGKRIIGKSDKALPLSTMYIGVSSELPAVSLKDVSFYFELQDVELNELFYHHLQNTKWYAKGDEINVTPGFYNDNDINSINLKSVFEDVSDKSNNIYQQINNVYRKHYVTIKPSSNDSQLVQSNFEELDDFIGLNNVPVEEGVKWLKVVFPSVITSTTLEKIYCSLNSFPALNREVKEFSVELKEYINIFSIKTVDLFLDVKSIVNTTGQSYRMSSKNNMNSEKGTFILRSDNVGKLDHRKASEYVVYLIELLKDESASFALFNNEHFETKLKELNQIIALLEKRVSETSNEVMETNYVVLKPYAKNEDLLVEYWITNGVLANGIKSGSDLEVYKGVDIKQKNSFFVTSSFGGQDDLVMQDRLNAYRRSLLSRDRVVTKEDVKALCYELYGDKIEGVEVQKGYVNDIALNKGLIQCIEILLYPNKQKEIELIEWESLNNNLLFVLEKKSINVFPYKIKTVK